jgi:hypothetical protein
LSASRLDDLLTVLDSAGQTFGRRRNRVCHSALRFSS